MMGRKSRAIKKKKEENEGEIAMIVFFCLQIYEMRESVNVHMHT